MKFSRRSLMSGVTFGLLMVSLQADATTIRLFVTGESPTESGVDVIYDVTANSTVAGSAIISIAITDSRALDGIALLPGTTSEVVVGARAGPPSIAHIDPIAGTTFADFVGDTSSVSGSGSTRPSSVFPTAIHVYYTENQFGFDGPPHRIMRVERTTGFVEVVFDGADTDAGGLVNFEGLVIVDGRLHFFAADPTPTVLPSRPLFSIGLDGTGSWDAAAPLELLGDLAAAVPPGDGSDELTFEPGVGGSGTIFGSNIINGEVIFWDVGAAAGGFFVDGVDIALSAALDGADDGDITILHDSFLSGSGFVFDDLTQIRVLSEPGTLALLFAGLVVGFGARMRKNNRSSSQPYRSWLGSLAN